MKRRKQRKSFVQGLVLALAVFVVLDFSMAQLLKTTTQREPPHVKLHGVPYGYGLRPNLDVVSAVWGHRNYRLRTNSVGFRDKAPREVSLDAGQRRVVFIGDSFAMGIGCRYEDTFAGLIDAALKKDGVEVLNAAVDGYSSWHYVEKVRYLVETVGLAFDELICCIDLSDVAEDLARNSAASPVTSIGQPHAAKIAKKRQTRLPHLPHRRSLRHHLRANSLLVELLYRIKLRLAPDMPIDQRAVLWTTEDSLYREFGEQGIALQKRNLDELHGVLRQHGIKLTVVVYPWIDQILRRDLDSRQVQIWREWCAANGAGFINCFPAFIGREADPMDTVYECFIRGDNHFNETGHKIMAEKLLEHLLTGEKNSREKAQEDST